MQTHPLTVTSPSKNELARSCKIMQDCARILHARLAWHVHVICPFSCTILAQSCTYLARNGARDAVRIITCKFGVSCTFFAELVQDCARTVQEKGHIVPCKSCMQDSCTILHDLASSFLLGGLSRSSPFQILDLTLEPVPMPPTPTLPPPPPPPPPFLHHL